MGFCKIGRSVRSAVSGVLSNKKRRDICMALSIWFALSILSFAFAGANALTSARAVQDSSGSKHESVSVMTGESFPEASENADEEDEGEAGTNETASAYMQSQEVDADQGGEEGLEAQEQEAKDSKGSAEEGGTASYEPEESASSNAELDKSNVTAMNSDTVASIDNNASSDVSEKSDGGSELSEDESDSSDGSLSETTTLSDSDNDSPSDNQDEDDDLVDGPKIGLMGGEKSTVTFNPEGSNSQSQTLSKYLQVGDTYTITIEGLSGASWSANNESLSVATSKESDQVFVITAVGEGTDTITYRTTLNNKSYTLTVSIVVGEEALEDTYTTYRYYHLDIKVDADFVIYYYDKLTGSLATTVPENVEVTQVSASIYNTGPSSWKQSDLGSGTYTDYNDSDTYNGQTCASYNVVFDDEASADANDSTYEYASLGGHKSSGYGDLEFYDGDTVVLKVEISYDYNGTTYTQDLEVIYIVSVYNNVCDSKNNTGDTRGFDIDVEADDITEVATSYVQKVDQYGNTVSGAVFALYLTDQYGYYYYVVDNSDSSVYADLSNATYDVDESTGVISNISGATFYTYSDGTFTEYGSDISGATITPKLVQATDSYGYFIFVYPDDYPNTDLIGLTMTMNDLKNVYGEYFAMLEIGVPEGYRSSADEIKMHVIGAGTTLALKCENAYGAAVSTGSIALVLSTDELYKAREDGNYTDYNKDDNVIDYVTVDEETNTLQTNGTLFAVVLKKGDNVSSSTIDTWYPVYGNEIDGYTVIDYNSDGSYSGQLEAAIAAALGQASVDGGDSDVVFSITESGANCAVSLSNLPGDITQYFTFIQEVNAADDDDTNDDFASIREQSEYFVAYYYTTADSLDGANSENTCRVISREGVIDNYSGFTVVWGSKIDITNYENRLYFQKTDEDGNVINDAVFALYSVDLDENNDYYYIADDGTHIYLEEDDDGDNTGAAYVNDKEGTYTISADASYDKNGDRGLVSTDGYGVITVEIGSDTYTISPVVNNNDYSMVGYTHSECDQIGETVEEGTGHFVSLSSGYYILREILAPEGYKLNTTEVQTYIDDEAVYANAGSEDDGVKVGKGPGYLASSLSSLASEGDINQTLSWIYAMLEVNSALSFADLLESLENGWSFATSSSEKGLASSSNYVSELERYLAMVTYLEYDHSDSAVFDYSPNENQSQREAAGSGILTKEGEGTRRLYTDVGWSKLAIYQDYSYGSINNTASLYEDLTQYGDISSLFSRSTFVVVADEEDVDTGDLVVSKTISGEGADAEKEFTFTVTLSDTSISGEYGDMTFENGVATFTLKGGESSTATGLPMDITYTVVESDNEGYIVDSTVDGVLVEEGQDTTGSIVAGETSTVEFNNFYPTPEKDVLDEDGGSIDGGDVSVGDILTYEITFKNESEETLDLTITDTPPENTELVSDSITYVLSDDSNASVTYDVDEDGLITWDVKGLEAGATIVVGFKVTVTEDALQIGQSSITNDATVVIGENTYVTNETTVYVPNPEKYVFDDEDVDINGENVSVGDVLTYVITFVNTTAETIDELTITDEPPAGTELVEDSITSEFSGTTDATVTYEISQDGQIIWTVKDFAPGDIVIVSFKVTVTEEAIVQGEVENTADVVIGENTYSTNQTVNPTDEEPNAALDLVKEETSTPANGEYYGLGETITWNVTVSNIGNLTIRDIVISDPLTGDEINVGTLAPGENATYEVSYTVTQSDVEAGRVYNVATATGTSEDPDNPNPSDEDDDDADTGEDSGEDPGEETGNLYLLKTVSGSGADYDQEFNFTITLSDTSISGEYGDMTFADGVCDLSLKAGESSTATGLPDKTTYKIVETNNVGYVVSVKVDGVKAEGSEATGEIPLNDTSAVEFNNYMPNPEKEVYKDGDIIEGDVSVGDVLTYEIEFSNETEDALDVKIIDSVPSGTKFVEDSVAWEIYGGDAENVSYEVSEEGTITWTVEGLETEAEIVVSFDVTVTEDALLLEDGIENTATVVIGDNTYTTNTTTNRTDEEPGDDPSDPSGSSDPDSSSGSGGSSGSGSNGSGSSASNGSSGSSGNSSSTSSKGKTYPVTADDIKLLLVSILPLLLFSSLAIFIRHRRRQQDSL